jgi:hypothetical protein
MGGRENRHSKTDTTRTQLVCCEATALDDLTCGGPSHHRIRLSSEQCFPSRGLVRTFHPLLIAEHCNDSTQSHLGRSLQVRTRGRRGPDRAHARFRGESQQGGPHHGLGWKVLVELGANSAGKWAPMACKQDSSTVEPRHRWHARSCIRSIMRILHYQTGLSAEEGQRMIALGL